jgi:oligopeptidase B
MDEWYFMPSDTPLEKPAMVCPREPEHEYDLDHREDCFIIHTNYKAKDFRVMKTPVETPGRDSWEEIIPHSKGILIDGVDVFRDFMVLTKRVKGLPCLSVHRFDTGEQFEVPMDEETYDVDCWGHLEYDTRIFRYVYSSMTTPDTVYDFDIDSRSSSMRKQKEIPDPSFVPGNYETRRITATAEDGTEVPVSLLYRKGTPRDGTAPCLLYGYGSYGASMDASFGHTRLSYVDRGFVFAIAHIRGGMEMGWDWYDNGRLFRKKNTFTDFIACAEKLIADGLTGKGRIAAAGGSAGGMLMGAVANMRPDLFGAVIAHVPFVDVLTTMLDPDLPLTTTEYNEWGNPEDPDVFRYILEYSPYDNVSEQEYPAILITAGLNDPRVTYWEPAKWCAKLRAMKTDSNILLLKTHMDFGHGGASGRFDYLEEIALDIAFALKALKLPLR